MRTLTEANIVAVDKDDIRRQALVAAEAATEKKGEDLLVLDVGEIIAITDFFVIVSAVNDRQVQTVVEEVEARLRDREALSPLRTEGLEECRWVLMDYGDFWVHVFHAEARGFYELERLWADAPRVDVEGLDAATG